MASRKCIEIATGADFCISAALALLLLPLKWILAAVAAAVFHEYCHYLALRLCGVRVYGVVVGSGGAVMETEAMSDLHELLCALAGPAGSFLLLSLVRFLPELAICAGIQGLYNLLPIYPLDGGRAVRSLLGMICPGKCEIVERSIRRSAIAVIFLCALIASFRLHLGIGPLAAACLLLLKTGPRKIPCKAAPERVQ